MARKILNRKTPDLLRKPITSADQIKVGMLVVFRCGFNPEASKYILTQGFIRSISHGRARIPAGSKGTFEVPVSPEFIRFELVNP